MFAMDLINALLSINYYGLMKNKRFMSGSLIVVYWQYSKNKSEAETNHSRTTNSSERNKINYLLISENK